MRCILNSLWQRQDHSNNCVSRLRLLVSVCVLCVCLFLTSLDASVVLELVAAGTLALEVTVGHSCDRGAIWAEAGVSLARLRQTEQAAGLVSAGVMAL